MSRGWAKASARSLQITLSCAFPCRTVSLQYFPRSSLHRLGGLPCRLFLSHGLQVVTREVHRSSLRRLICPAQDHFIFLTVLIISMTFVLSLTQMLVFLSLYVMLSILLSILVCAAASLFCGCLASVQVSAPYIIAGSAQKFYTCLFRQILHAGFHGIPFHAGQCGLEGGTEIGVPSLDSCVSAPVLLLNTLLGGVEFGAPSLGSCVPSTE